MLKLTKIFLLFICSASVANASVFTPDKIAELQKIIGYDVTAQITGQGMPLEQAEASGSAKRQQTHDEEQSYQCTKDHCEVGYTFSTEATIARETEIEKAGFIKDKNGVVQNNKGFLDKAMDNIKEAKGKFDYLSGGYAECKPNKDITTSSSIETCDEYFDVKHNTCFPQQVVEIDPKYTYQCSTSREVKEKVCEDVLKSLKCNKSAECDSGGIILSSVDSNIGWQYTYPKLIIGTLSRISDPHMCHIATKVIKFEVKNKEQIEQFKIDNINYSDHIRISLNGIQVLNTISGGDGEYFATTRWGRKLEKRGAEFGKVLSGGSYASRCNTKQYYSINPGVDLRPQLKDGLNELKIELAFGNNGQLHVHLMTKQHCCTEWIEEREVKCEFL